MKSTGLHQNRQYFDREEGMRVAVSLEHGWKYIPDVCISDKLKSIRYDAYGLTKTGAQVFPAAMSYDDSQWQESSLIQPRGIIMDIFRSRVIGTGSSSVCRRRTEKRGLSYTLKESAEKVGYGSTVY